jgi:hypothetical protein
LVAVIYIALIAAPTIRTLNAAALLKQLANQLRIYGTSSYSAVITLAIRRIRKL